LELGRPIGAYKSMTVHLSPPPPLHHLEFWLPWRGRRVASPRRKIE
jgi:hypothetical protein